MGALQELVGQASFASSELGTEDGCIMSKRVIGSNSAVINKEMNLKIWAKMETAR